MRLSAGGPRPTARARRRPPGHRRRPGPGNRAAHPAPRPRRAAPVGPLRHERLVGGGQLQHRAGDTGKRLGPATLGGRGHGVQRRRIEAQLRAHGLAEVGRGEAPPPLVAVARRHQLRHGAHVAGAHRRGLLRRGRAVVGAEAHHLVAPAALGQIHGPVGLVDELLLERGVGRAGSHADADRKARGADLVAQNGGAHALGHLQGALLAVSTRMAANSSPP